MTAPGPFARFALSQDNVPDGPEPGEGAPDGMFEKFKALSIADPSKTATFEGHFSGTTYHKAKESSWIKFWLANAGPLPDDCPGQGSEAKGAKSKRHPLTPSNVVGAHVLITTDEGDRLPAIVPCCKECNNTHRECPIVHTCKAVVIMDYNKCTMAGVLETIKAKDGANAKRFKTITDVSTEGNAVTITGTDCTRVHGPLTQTYPDNDTFLLSIAQLLMRKQALEGKKFKIEFDQHQPRVVSLRAKGAPL